MASPAGEGRGAEGIYVSDTLSTDTTYTDANSPVPNLTEYRVQAIDRVYNAGESSESVRVGSQ